MAGTTLATAGLKKHCENACVFVCACRGESDSHVFIFLFFNYLFSFFVFSLFSGNDTLLTSFPSFVELRGGVKNVSIFSS